MEKRILGLDPGIAILGFGAIICQPSPNLTRKTLDFGVIETPAKTPIGDRLGTIYEDLHT